MIPWKQTKDLKSSLESVFYCFSHTSATLIRFCPMLIEFVAYEITPNMKCTGTKVKFLHINTSACPAGSTQSKTNFSHI